MGLYPLAVLALAVAGFATSSLAHASGFLSVYVAGLVLGDPELPHRPATRGFAEGCVARADRAVRHAPCCSSHRRHCPARFCPRSRWAPRCCSSHDPISVVILFLPLPNSAMAPIGLQSAGAAVFVVGRPSRCGADRARNCAGYFGFTQRPSLRAGVRACGRLHLGAGSDLPVVARILRLTGIGEPGQIDVEAAPLGNTCTPICFQLVIPPGSLLHGVEIFPNCGCRADRRSPSSSAMA